MQDYGAFVKPRNSEYRSLLSNIENSLEYLLGGNLKIGDDEESQKELTIF